MAWMPSPGGHSHLFPDNLTAPGWGLGPRPDRPWHTCYHGSALKMQIWRCPFFHFKSFKAFQTKPNLPGALMIWLCQGHQPQLLQAPCRTVPGATSGSQTPGPQVHRLPRSSFGQNTLSPHQPSTPILVPTWPFPLCSAMGPWQHPPACGFRGSLATGLWARGWQRLYLFSFTKLHPTKV